jgi:hypothetical protein
MAGIDLPIFRGTGFARRPTASESRVSWTSLAGGETNGLSVEGKESAV